MPSVAEDLGGGGGGYSSSGLLGVSAGVLRTARNNFCLPKGLEVGYVKILDMHTHSTLMDLINEF